MIKVTENIKNYINSIKKQDEIEWELTRSKLSNEEIGYMLKNYIPSIKFKDSFGLSNEDLHTLTEWNPKAKALRMDAWENINFKEDMLDAFESYVSDGEIYYILTNRFWGKIKNEVGIIDTSHLELKDY